MKMYHIVFIADMIRNFNLFSQAGWAARIDTISPRLRLKHPQFSILIGLPRQFIAPVPVFWLLSLHFGGVIHAIWWGILLIICTAAIVSIFYDRIRFEV
jgi:hypothetical protein